MLGCCFDKRVSVLLCILMGQYVNIMKVCVWLVVFVICDILICVNDFVRVCVVFLQILILCFNQELLCGIKVFSCLKCGFILVFGIVFDFKFIIKFCMGFFLIQFQILESIGYFMWRKCNYCESKRCCFFRLVVCMKRRGFVDGFLVLLVIVIISSRYVKVMIVLQFLCDG